MKLELKENMYCRTRGGAIGKIVSLEDFNEREYKLNGFYVNKDAIKKASYNIAEDYFWLKNQHIKSIVTKEQMEQMAYKVDDI